MPSPRGREGPKYSIGGAASQLETHRRAGGLPGPGEYDTPTTIGGEHSLSTRSNAPRYGWGTGGRDKLAAGGMIGLGAKPACSEFYEVTASIGQQPTSTRSTRPAYSLSMDARFDDKQKMRSKAAAPGPGSYNTVAGTGTQTDSTKISNPQYGFGRNQRFRPPSSSRETKLVGDLRSAVGRQVVSDRRSKPQFRFGSARRFEWDRPASAQAKYSTPGPGAYNA